MPTARFHHYVFAHQALPQLSASSPRESFAALNMPERNEALLHLWKHVGDQLPEGEAPIEPDGLSASVHAIGDFVIILVTMPPPLFSPEAYFGALAFGPFGGEQDPTHRYFTLERSVSIHGADTTVLAEWKNSVHHNLGPGSPPVADLFLNRVTQLMSPPSG
jgi:hypothetical protein